MSHDYETKSRLVARILRELLRTTTFDSIADLSVALKDRLSSLKIDATSDDLSAAYAMLESNAEIVAPDPRLKPVQKFREQMPDTPTLNKSEAAQVYRQLLARYRAEQPQESIPGAPEHFPSLMRVN